MIPLRIEMRNFQSYTEPETVIEFQNMNYACLCGENGHGKSTIIDAMLFALWGKGRAPVNADFINTCATEARVEFEFETEGVQYRITRTLTKKKDRAVSTYDLQVYDPGPGKWKPLGQGQKGKSTIEDILKMDYNAFICSSFILQGGANEFTKRTPSERKDVLATILNLADYENLSSRCRAFASNHEQAIRLYTGMLERVPTSIVTVKEAEKALNEQQGRLDFYLSEQKHTQSLIDGYVKDEALITAKLESFERLAEEGNELGIERHNLKSKIAFETDALDKILNLLSQNEEAITKDADRYVELAAEKEELHKKFSETSIINNEISFHVAKHEKAKEVRQNEIEALESDIAAEETELVRIQSGPKATCRTCGSTLDEEKTKRVLDNLVAMIEAKKKSLSNLQSWSGVDAAEEEKLKDLEKRRDAIGWDKDRESEVSRQMALLEYAVQAKEEIHRAKIKKEHQEKAIKRYEERFEAVEKRLSFIVTETAKADPLKDELKKTTSLLVQARTMLSNTNRELEKNRDQVESTKALIKEIKRCAEDRRKLEADIKSAEKKKFLHDELAKAFGKNGIQALMIENAVPDIEAEANDILAKLTEGKMRITLDMIKPTQKGTEKETLEIRIEDPLGVRSYETFSGGEAFRIDFALRVAISKFIANRAGAQLRTLVIDEGFGSQDKKGIQYFIEAIDSIKDDFDMVLVVTHLEDMKDRFPVRIEVVKEPDTGSRAEVVFS